MQLAPAAWSFSTADFPAASFISESATWAPFAASASENASPIPLAAPVTIATFPFKFSLMVWLLAAHARALFELMTPTLYHKLFGLIALCRNLQPAVGSPHLGYLFADAAGVLPESACCAVGGSLSPWASSKATCHICSSESEPAKPGMPVRRIPFLTFQ